MTYPDEPGHLAGSDTSREAAERIADTGKPAAIGAWILTELEAHPDGLTSGELFDHYVAEHGPGSMKSQSDITPRTGEMTTADLIHHHRPGASHPKRRWARDGARVCFVCQATLPDPSKRTDMRQQVLYFGPHPSGLGSPRKPQPGPYLARIKTVVYRPAKQAWGLSAIDAQHRYREVTAITEEWVEDIFKWEGR